MTHTKHVIGTRCPQCGFEPWIIGLPTDPIAALDREDVERAITALRAAAASGRVAFRLTGAKGNGAIAVACVRVADVLAESLIGRGDA